jgi:hypothetical protein
MNDQYIHLSTCQISQICALAPFYTIGNNMLQNSNKATSNLLCLMLYKRMFEIKRLETV